MAVERAELAALIERDFLEGFAFWAPDASTVSVEVELDPDGFGGTVVFAIGLSLDDGWERYQHRAISLEQAPGDAIREAKVSGIRLGAALGNSLVLHEAGDITIAEGLERGVLPRRPWTPDDVRTPA